MVLKEVSQINSNPPYYDFGSSSQSTGPVSSPLSLNEGVELLQHSQKEKSILKRNFFEICKNVSSFIYQRAINIANQATAILFAAYSRSTGKQMEPTPKSYEVQLFEAQEKHTAAIKAYEFILRHKITDTASVIGCYAKHAHELVKNAHEDSVISLADSEAFADATTKFITRLSEIQSLLQINGNPIKDNDSVIEGEELQKLKTEIFKITTEYFNTVAKPMLAKLKNSPKIHKDYSLFLKYFLKSFDTQRKIYQSISSNSYVNTLKECVEKAEAELKAIRARKASA